MASPIVLAVNDIDFTDLFAYEGLTVSREGLQADGSGRNPLNGIMRFVTVKIVDYVELQIRNDAPQERVAQFTRAIWQNGQVNAYTFWNPLDNNYKTIQGYVNKQSVSIFNIYYDIAQRTRVMIKSFPIQITEL